MANLNPYVTIDPYASPIQPVAEMPREPAMPSSAPVRTQAEMRNGTWPPPRQVGFLVIGTPRPKGSKDYKGKRRNGSAILTESADVRPWQAAVAAAAHQTGMTFAGPVEVLTEFRLPRPAKVRDAMTGLGQNAGDGDKLTRAVWDGLKEGGMIEDDSKVLRWSGSKRLAEPGEPTGAYVTVKEWRR